MQIEYQGSYIKVTNKKGRIALFYAVIKSDGSVVFSTNVRGNVDNINVSPWYNQPNITSKVKSFVLNSSKYKTFLFLKELGFIKVHETGFIFPGKLQSTFPRIEKDGQ